MVNKGSLSLYLLLLILAAGCATNRSRMFRVSEEDRRTLADSINKVEGNYHIRKNDYLHVSVYTNGGERIIDPNYELNTNAAGQRQLEEMRPKFLVRDNGLVKLPMVGDIHLEGLTLYQADTLLANVYSKFYEEVFVITKLVNKRVVVFGPLGGKVVPLENENMNLIEVIALYGGITEQGKSFNIRLISGDLNNPDVQIIDLSTIEGMRHASLDINGNEIVYIETKRKIFLESVRDIAPLIGLVGNLVTVLFLITR